MCENTLDDILKKHKLNYAGFGLRLGAYFMDMIPILLLVYVILFFVFGISPIRLPDAELEYDQGQMARSTARFISFFIWIIYCAFMEASSYQASFGKRMVGIKVVNYAGEPLNLNQAFKRNGAKIISYLTIGIGFLWVLFDKQKRALHDIIGETFVVHNEEEV